MFQPETEYDVFPPSIDIKDFYAYPETFVTTDGELYISVPPSAAPHSEV